MLSAAPSLVLAFHAQDSAIRWVVESRVEEREMSDTPTKGSLTDQILDHMFASLQARAEFDLETIEKLRQLAATSDLDKAGHIIKAIKPTPGATP